MSEFYRGGQRAWFHDEGHPAGFFHTYDALNVGGEARKIHVFLPRNYEETNDRYPVLYTNDGDTTFFPGGAIGLSWHMGETLSQLVASGRIQQPIVVAVYTVDREREYTHAPSKPRVFGKGSCCGVEDYTNYLADNLKPFIDTYYRTNSEAENTTIMGASHGGLAAFYTACRRCDRFGNGAALSPSFWVGLDTGTSTLTPLEKSSLLELTAAKLSDRSTHPRLWIDWGLVRSGGYQNWFIEGNTTRRSREMVKLLEKEFGYVRDRNLFAYEDPEGEHSEASWARRLPMVLEALFGNWS